MYFDGSKNLKMPKISAESLVFFGGKKLGQNVKVFQIESSWPLGVIANTPHLYDPVVPGIWGASCPPREDHWHNTCTQKKGKPHRQPQALSLDHWHKGCAKLELLNRELRWNAYFFIIRVQVRTRIVGFANHGGGVHFGKTLVDPCVLHRSWTAKEDSKRCSEN